MGLPQAIASTLLQQHVNAAFQSQQQTALGTIVAKPLSQVDGCSDADLFDMFMSTIDCTPTLSSADRLLLKSVPRHTTEPSPSDPLHPAASCSTAPLMQTCPPSLLQCIVDAGFPERKPEHQVPVEINVVMSGATKSGLKKRKRLECFGAAGPSAALFGAMSKQDASLLKKLRLVYQADGPLDTSDEEEEGSDDDDEDDDPDDDKDEEDQEVDEGGPEEEPLNTDDDVTDEDNDADLFNTENVVVCQYDKITRSRNKWKFHLKDGIMNLDGEDLIFQKANGDAEW